MNTPADTQRCGSSAGAPPPGRIRVIVVDDHAAVREGIRAMLTSEPDLEPIAATSTAADALALAKRERPDDELAPVLAHPRFARKAPLLLEDRLEQAGAEYSKGRLPLRPHIRRGSQPLHGTEPRSSEKLAERLVADISAFGDAVRSVESRKPAAVH